MMEITMVKKKNVPVLRFPEFEEKWELKKMIDFTKINQGLQIAISERFTEKVDNSYFYITNEFLKKNSEKKYFIKNPPESVLCNKDDILMTRTGNTGKVVTGVVGAFHNNFFKIKYKEEICDKSFLYQFLILNKTQQTIMRLAGTSTIPDLNHGDFYKIKINLPSLKEQKKVANFLTVIDEKIQQLTQKKTLLEEYKKGVMQKVFKQEIRFKDEKGKAFPEWEEKQLGEIAHKIMYGMNSAAIPYDGKNKYIRITDINEESRTFIPNPLTSPNGEIKDKYKLKKGDLVFARTGASVGKSYLYKEEDGNLFFAGFLIKFSLTNGNPYFVFIQTLRSFYKKWVQIMSVRSGQPGINAEEYKTFKIPFPSILEQERIANLLISIDKKIENISTQIKQTQHFKKGLLQKMFV